jgi:hypothetical protein
MQARLFDGLGEEEEFFGQAGLSLLFKCGSPYLCVAPSPGKPLPPVHDTTKLFLAPWRQKVVRSALTSSSLSMRLSGHDASIIATLSSQFCLTALLPLCDDDMLRASISGMGHLRCFVANSLKSCHLWCLNCRCRPREDVLYR